MTDASSQAPLSRYQPWRQLFWPSGRPVNSGPALMLAIATAGAPLLFGSRDLVTIAFWCIWLGIAVMLLSPKGIRRSQGLCLGALAALAGAYALVLHEQLAATPWMAPYDPLWAKAATVLGTRLAPSASIAKNAALYNAGALIANGLALTVGLVAGADRRLARMIVISAGVSGAAYAAYGLFAMIVTPNLLLWREKEAYAGSLTGTFVNRNTAATYFGSVAIIWLLLLLEDVRNRLPRVALRWASIWKAAGIQARPRVFVLFAMFFISVAALMLTQSRAGVILSGCALLSSFWFHLYGDRVQRPHRMIGLCIAGLCSLAVLQVFAGSLGSRLDFEGLTDKGRLSVYEATLRIIAAHPWFGTGLGTFPWSFPLFRGDGISMWGIWEMAHSTPLQMASEMGIPLALLAALAWMAALATLLRAAFVRRRDTIIPLSAFGISALALAHSSVDFSLQIAGYSIFVFAILGVGLAQSFRTAARSRAGFKLRSSSSNVETSCADSDGSRSAGIAGP